MMEWHIIFIFFAGFLLAFYCLLLGIQSICWLKIPTFKTTGQNCITNISIIIAMRNEEENISSCLRSIARQKYPPDLFEIIVIDDQSTDSSVIQVKKIIAEHQHKLKIQLLELKHGKLQNSYKKFAISEGIKKAKGQLIITTDADCIAGENWLHTIASYYEKHKPVMMMCPVSFKTDSSLFSRMQALEFIGLIGMGASTNKAGFPLMCNGANLAYSRKAFEEINGYGQTPELASGDDTFLMFKMKDRFANGIHFIKSNEANVMTTPQTNVGTFFQQRKRWASKTTYYKRNYVTLTGIMIYLFNFMLLFAGLLAGFFKSFLTLFLIMLAGKLIFEFLFMTVVCIFFKQQKLLKIFLPTALLFTPYILLVGITAPFGTYEWKGRKVK